MHDVIWKARYTGLGRITRSICNTYAHVLIENDVVIGNNAAVKVVRNIGMV